MRSAVLSLIPVFALVAAELPPCPQPIPGFVPPAPGEHPRLFFRKADLPKIKERAATEDGKKIVARIRLVLDGANGDTLPEKYNNQAKIVTQDHSPSSVDKEPLGKAFTLWHPVGYGMLFYLTGEKKYADLARQCAEKMLDGQRDRDSVYSWYDPHGALRAGPSIGSMAMAYDLNYDGWDEAFRKDIAKCIATFKGPKEYTSLAQLAVGSRHNPPKNHWGGQVGGAAMALLAINGDPGIENQEEITKLLELNKNAMRRQLDEGYSEFGFQSEGQGPGGITSDTAYVPALQAWRVAGGMDYLTPRPRASWILMLKVHDLYLINNSPWLMNRNMGYGGSYGIGDYSPEKERHGVSRGGQWAQGFGAIEDKYKGAALWCYNHILEPDPAKRTYDTVSYPAHRAVLSLINWPIGLAEQNPAEVLPKLIKDDNGYITTRNGWTGVNDCGFSMMPGPKGGPIMAWGLGIRVDWGAALGSTHSHWEDRPDGSFSLGNDKGGGYIAVDFSKKSGADMLLALAGKAVGKDGEQKGPDGASMLATTHKLGGKDVQIRTYARGKQPERKESGDALTVGGQTVKFDGAKFTLAW